jgi:hypothetical protein
MSGFQQPHHSYGGGSAPPDFYSQRQDGDTDGGRHQQQQQQQQQQQRPDFLSGISPEMLNMGLSAGKNMFSAERDKWMPGVSTFFSALKIYFAVSV